MRLKYTAILSICILGFFSCSDTTEPESSGGEFVVDSLNASCRVYVDERDMIISSYHVRYYYHFEECAGTVSTTCCSISTASGRFCMMPIFDPVPDYCNRGELQDDGIGIGRSEDWSDHSTAMVCIRVGGEFWQCSIGDTYIQIGTFSWQDSIEVEIVSELE